MLFKELMQFMMQRPAVGQVFRQLIFTKPAHLAGFIADGCLAPKQFAQKKQLMSLLHNDFRIQPLNPMAV